MHRLPQKKVQTGRNATCANNQAFKRAMALRQALPSIAAMLFAFSVPAKAQEPIKIGFSMALTGPLAANGKQALLGMKIWEEETNAKGGLLGRPVKLVYYDDQTNASTVPGIYTKLHRRRQGRPRSRALRHQHGGAGHAGRHAEGQAVHHPVRARCEPRVQVQQVLRHDPDRARTRSRPSPRASSRWRRRRTPSRRRRRWWRPMPSSPATPARAPARTPRSTASRSSTTRPIRRRRPTSRRSCAPSRPPTRTSSRSAPIRSTRSAWSRRSTSSASSRR